MRNQGRIEKGLGQVPGVSQMEMWLPGMCSLLERQYSLKRVFAPVGNCHVPSCLKISDSLGGTFSPRLHSKNTHHLKNHILHKQQLCVFSEHL